MRVVDVDMGKSEVGVQKSAFHERHSLSGQSPRMERRLSVVHGAREYGFDERATSTAWRAVH